MPLYDTSLLDLLGPFYSSQFEQIAGKWLDGIPPEGSTTPEEDRVFQFALQKSAKTIRNGVLDFLPDNETFCGVLELWADWLEEQSLAARAEKLRDAVSHWREWSRQCL